LLISGCKGNVTPHSPEIESEQINSVSISEIDITKSGTFSGHVMLEKYNFPIGYAISLPELTQDETVPLVIALHFSGGEGLSFLERLMIPGLSELNAIIIAPTAPDGSDWTLTRTTDMIAELVELAILNWPVNPKKIIVVGYSMGGFGAWELMSSHPELFSAAIPIASSPRDWIDTISTEVPIYAIHPEFDEGIPLNRVEEEIQQLKDREANVQLVVAIDTDHYDFDLMISYLYETMDWLKYSVWADR
jgi:predicted esterase